MQLNIFYLIVYFVGIIPFYIYLLINFMLIIFSLLLGKRSVSICQVSIIIYKLCLSFRSVMSVCLFCHICLSVCLSVAVCVLLLLHVAPKTRRLRVVLVLQQQKAVRACDLRWFRPPLVNLTTEDDSRIERI